VSTRTTLPEDLTNRHSGHPGHTSRYARFSSFSCPAPAPALEYHLYAVCGSSSRSDKGLRPAAPLNGSTHPPSWRAVRGSAPPLAGKDFRLAVQRQMFTVFGC
jgi:hypothetical protein